MTVRIIWLPNGEYLRDHRYKGTNMAYKCNIFVPVTWQFMGIGILYRYKCVCTISNVIGINEEKAICMPYREYVRKSKYCCQMHSTYACYSWAKSPLSSCYFFHIC